MQRLRQLWVWGLPVVVLGVFLVLLATADRSPAADGPHMLAQSLRLGLLARQGEVVVALDKWAGMDIPHPPAGYLPTLLIGLLVGPWLGTRWVVALASTFCLGLLLDALARISRPAPWWGVQVAWLLASGAAITWWAADHYGFDLVASVVVLQALSWLQASRGLEDRRASVMFGLWLGVGFLTKYSVPLICLLPVVLVCGRYVFKRPGHVLLAFLAWLAITLPYYLFKGDAVTAYVHSALSPPDAPGNFPIPLTLAQRFSGAGQLRFVAVLKDALGWPGLVAMVAAAAVSRRLIPLAAVASGLVLLGAMNSQEGRYALPLIFLLAAAAIPRRGPAWKTTLLLGAVALPLFWGSASTFATMTQERAPARRPLGHTVQTFAHWGRWPWPEQPFMPISEHPDRWKVGWVLDTLLPLAEADGSAAMLLDQDIEGPGISTYQLLAVERGSTTEFLPIHVRMGERGLETASRKSHHKEPTVAYVVRRDGPRSAGAAWLARVPHQVLQALDLPHNCTGTIIRLQQPLSEDPAAGDALRGAAHPGGPAAR